MWMPWRSSRGALAAVGAAASSAALAWRMPPVAGAEPVEQPAHSATSASSTALRRDALGRPRPMMFVRDPDGFAKKWKKFSTDGLNKMVVIADFDFTLTPFTKANGERGDSSHGVLTRTDVLGHSLRDTGNKLFRKYYPIEQCTALTAAEKLPFLLDWWNGEHDSLVQHQLTRHTLQQAVAASDITFRDGFMDIFELLAQEQVPTLIFSAGLYDVIHAVLDKEYAKTARGTVPGNVHVISNMMRFDSDGLLMGFDGEIIHSLNKNASVVTDTPFWRRCQLEERHNILLLGDSLSDADMAMGLDFHDDQIVRIGFLNDRVDEKLELYLQKFDVVLTHDSSLLPVELMLHQVERAPAA